MEPKSDSIGWELGFIRHDACTISVYEKKDGRTYIASMNAGLLGKMFGGSIAEVMGDVVAKQQQEKCYSQIQHFHGQSLN